MQCSASWIPSKQTIGRHKGQRSCSPEGGLSERSCDASSLAVASDVLRFGKSGPVPLYIMALETSA